MKMSLESSKALTFRCVMNSVLICLTNCALESPGLWLSDLLLIWYWLLQEMQPWELWTLPLKCVMEFASISLRARLRELQALTDRFVMDSALVLLKKWACRAPSSNGQICDGFYIHFVKKIKLGSSKLDGQICNCFCIDFVKKISLESSRARTDRFVMDF